MFRVMSTEGGEVTKALKLVIEKVSATTAARSPPVSEWCAQPRLVAVSKTKPKEMIIEAYLAGQRHFGENYIQELVNKAHDPEVVERCPNICWHMIGPMQSNKVKKVLTIPNLYLVETVHSAKLATILHNTWSKLDQQKRTDKLNVFIQVNTSNEPQKSGVPPDELISITEHIRDNCPSLKLKGLMTIGIFDHDLTTGPNPDFQSLLSCREAVCAAHDLTPSDLELSMGMSGDFEHAIEVGSTNVRVGSTIFGARNYNK